ncbi:hypothetical protein SVIO_100400 [Streptomyces violaceusniger]|uniref:Enoyl reductase (ER) domain-containing protein n=1 Tax=Streptomyces violaceusniger TaxID=68280 RepID=A0A4D4LM50_STRVO|nr:hypothetical protein SVIO_100400 [Streptomyces violaceusniger]
MSHPTSQSLVLEEFGTLPRLVERPVPEPRPGHTLVRMKAAAVSHLDLNVVDGRFGILPDLPSVPGTEGSGTVVASDTHPEGSLVRLRGKALGLRRDGTWGGHALVPDAAVEAVPDGTDPALACCYFSPAGTAWASVHSVAGIRPGERVLVTGAAGAVGALTVQVAARAGAEVIGVVGRPAKLPHVPAPPRRSSPPTCPPTRSAARWTWSSTRWAGRSCATRCRWCAPAAGSPSSATPRVVSSPWTWPTSSSPMCRCCP